MNKLELFECPVVPDKVKLKLTKFACAKQYQKSKTPIFGYANSSSMVFTYCKDCKIGKKNYDIFFKKEIKKKEEKTCKLYKVLPKECKNKKEKGVFKRNYGNVSFAWKNKLFCCEECTKNYYRLKQNGVINDG